MLYPKGQSWHLTCVSKVIRSSSGVMLYPTRLCLDQPLHLARTLYYNKLLHLTCMRLICII